jgi:hypothetical protein
MQPEDQNVATEGSVSKSAFLLGTQCPRLLWTWYPTRDESPRPNQGTRTVLDQDQIVEAMRRIWNE